MATPIFLTTIAGGILFVMGTMHLLLTLIDVRSPRSFTPSDDSVRVAMQNSMLRFARGRTSTWDAWLGFNVSHSLGVMVFGGAAIFVPALATETQRTAVLVVLAALSIVYLATSIRFWFYKPTIGLTTATLLFLSALALHGTSG